VFVILDLGCLDSSLFCESLHKSINHGTPWIHAPVKLTGTVELWVSLFQRLNSSKKDFTMTREKKENSNHLQTGFLGISGKQRGFYLVTREGRGNRMVAHLSFRYTPCVARKLSKLHAMRLERQICEIPYCEHPRFDRKSLPAGGVASPPASALHQRASHQGGLCQVSLQRRSHCSYQSPPGGLCRATWIDARSGGVLTSEHSAPTQLHQLTLPAHR
jgi:hypothetical protein